MGMLNYVPPADPHTFCLCFPPLYFTVGIGTVWQCDNCGRVYELVADRGEGRGSGWKRQVP